jgi:hypothetical protein
LTTKTQDQIVGRAVDLAHKWYPPGSATITVGKVDGGAVVLLVEVGGDIKTVRYVDLDQP